MFRFMVFLFLWFGLLTGIAAETITIGTGADVSFGMPLDGFWSYNYSQNIYYKSEINKNMTISRIAYNYTGNPWTVTDVKIFMGHTTKTAFNSTSDWIPITNLNQVFSGSISVSSGWVEIILDTPFVYNGIDNLVVALDENEPGYHGSSSDDFYGTPTANLKRGLRIRGENPNPDPAVPYDGALISGFANIKLVSPVVGPIFKITPENKNFGLIQINSTSQSQNFTIKNNGADTLKISSIELDGSGNNQFILTNQNNFPICLAANQAADIDVTFAPTIVGSITANLKINGNAKEVHNIPITGIAEAIPFFSENFDSSQWPPNNWSVINTAVVVAMNGDTLRFVWSLGDNSSHPFSSVNPNSLSSAICPYSPENVEQNEWIISPDVNISTISNPVLSFYAGFGREWLPGYEPGLGADLIFKVSSNNGTNWTDVWKASTDNNPEIAWSWRKITIPNLNYYGNNLKFAWVVLGKYGDVMGLDQIRINGLTGIETDGISIASSELKQNYPNPFNPTTTINFTLTETGKTKLVITNAKGEIVKELVNNELKSGYHSYNFDGSGFVSGIYFYQLTTSEKTITKKMLLVK